MVVRERILACTASVVDLFVPFVPFALTMKIGIFLVCVVSLLMTAATHAEPDPVAGKQKAKICMDCHGTDGNSVNPKYPKLAGQLEDYIVSRHWTSG